MFGSKVVFRCFKCLERTADRITGAAGPVFIALAVLLIGAGAVSFFDVLFPQLSLIPQVICILIATNLAAHYWWVITVKPGFADDPPVVEQSGWLWATKKKHRVNARVTPASIGQCRKCGSSKPERTHHCRICNRCVLKYDHHCPWINQCVGIHNEKHFVLFMAYLFVATMAFVIAGYSTIAEAFTLSVVSLTKWPHRSPQVIFMLAYILSFVIMFAIGIMGGYHLSIIMYGETSVEAQDFLYYTKMAKERGDHFVNSYDLGKRKNLELFFNVGQLGQYPIWSLFLPLRTQPYTDGRSWARREGYDRHRGVRGGDELTDDEDVEEV
ncbi:DHHC palmitoyltransferase-domain-containing protein [Flagelloscypha sp. PMI_526]|nr:DHHC palmitoyltransferase-domain-containing protein [Flagelloscypha sp. PMI_526]